MFHCDCLGQNHNNNNNKFNLKQKHILPHQTADQVVIRVSDEYLIRLYGSISYNRILNHTYS